MNTSVSIARAISAAPKSADVAGYAIIDDISRGNTRYLRGMRM